MEGVSTLFCECSVSCEFPPEPAQVASISRHCDLARSVIWRAFRSGALLLQGGSLAGFPHRALSLCGQGNLKRHQGLDGRIGILLRIPTEQPEGRKLQELFSSSLWKKSGLQFHFHSLFMKLFAVDQNTCVCLPGEGGRFREVLVLCIRHFAFLR